MSAVLGGERLGVEVCGLSRVSCMALNKPLLFSRRGSLVCGLVTSAVLLILCLGGPTLVFLSGPACLSVTWGWKRADSWAPCQPNESESQGWALGFCMPNRLPGRFISITEPENHLSFMSVI